MIRLGIVLVAGTVMLSWSGWQAKLGEREATVKVEKVKLAQPKEHAQSALTYLVEARPSRKGRVLTVNLAGSLPNPSYVLQPVRAELRGNTILIALTAKSNTTGATIQVLKEFEKTIELQLPGDGAYILVIPGRNDCKVVKVPEGGK